MGISVSGVGSGLDVDGIVNQLMSLEAQPLYKLKENEADFKAQLSAYNELETRMGTFRSAMKELGSISNFKVYSSSSANTDVIDITTSSVATQGSYDIQVVQLAESQKLRTNAYPTDEDFGEGSLTLSLGGTESFTVNLTAGEASLSDIQKAINNAPDNPGITASLITNGDQRYISFTADKTGADNTIDISSSVTSAGANFDLSELETANLTEIQAAQDAILYLDDYPSTHPTTPGNGLEITSASNNVTGVIEGVTLDIHKVDSSFVTVNIDRDMDAVVDKVGELVNSYNLLQDYLSEMRTGPLRGDSTLSTIERQVRLVFNTPPTGLTTSLGSLSEIGIKTNKDGSVSLDSAELRSVLDTDFGGVGELLASDDQGYAFRLQALADSFVTTNGVIDLRQDGINDRLKSVAKSIEQMNTRLDDREASYRKTYASLDTLIAQMQSTGSYITQQLASL